MITVTSGVWLILWIFLLTIGWSFPIRQNIIQYKMGSKLTVFPNCCQHYGKNFHGWFKNEYLPSILLKQHEKIDHRKFLVFQPSSSLSFENKINGLLSSFALAIISNRELIVDWPNEMNLIFKSPGWVWTYSELFPHTSLFNQPVTFDFVTSPSFIVPPAHKWKWSDLLQADVTKKMFGSQKIVAVNIDEFIAPLLWANPVYRDQLCKLSNIDQIYQNFASVLLQFSDQVIEKSKQIQNEVGNTSIISIVDTKLASFGKLKSMTDTLLRCMDSINNQQKNWLIVKKGFTFSSVIKWKKIGIHDVFTFSELKCLKNANKNLQNAALFYYSKNAEAVLGFTGSKLAESIAYGFNKSLFLVLHRVPFCNKVAIRLPCVEKWPSIVNSKGIDLSRFMVSEFNNYMHCKA